MEVYFIWILSIYTFYSTSSSLGTCPVPIVKHLKRVMVYHAICRESDDGIEIALAISTSFYVVSSPISNAIPNFSKFGDKKTLKFHLSLHYDLGRVAARVQNA